MSQHAKTFQDGDIIFRKGEPAKAAFEILSGTVEVVHFSINDGRTSKVLHEGEIFGEIGLIDGGPRETDALALGPVSVRVIPRKTLLAQMESQPDTAFKVMSKLAKRMKSPEDDPARMEAYRNVSSQLPVPIDPPEPAKMVGRKLPTNLMGGHTQPTFLERMLGGGLILGKPKEPKIPPPEEFTILLCQLSADDEDGQQDLIAEALSNIPGITLKLLDRNLASQLPLLGGISENTPSDDILRTATREGRAWMREENADLLIWGEVEETGRFIDLRFVSVASSPGERPGRFTQHDHLIVPADFYDDWIPLVRAVIMGVLDPRSMPQGRILRSILPPTARAARQMGMDPGAGMDDAERASVLMCFGNVACMCALLEADRSWYQSAAESYRSAIECLPPESRELRGHAYQQLGLVLQLIAERSGNIGVLEQAADAYREALKQIARQKSPADWGLLKFRLGGVLYKLDMTDEIEADDDALKEAIFALQSAAEVFTPYTHPIRYSEVMNLLAQCLQVYGDNLKSAPIIRRAIKTCHEALNVRTPDTAPLQWASIQNTLGSALFLLAKHTGNAECISMAGQAFQTALIVYNEHGASKLARITERNLKRAEKRVAEAAKRPRNVLSPADLLNQDSAMIARTAAKKPAAQDDDLALRTMLERINETEDNRSIIPGQGGLV